MHIFYNFSFSQHIRLDFEYLRFAILHIFNTVSTFALMSLESKMYLSMTPVIWHSWNSNFRSFWPLCRLNWKCRRACCGVWSWVFHWLTNPLTRGSPRLSVTGSSCSFWTWTAAHCSWAKKGPLITATLTSTGSGQKGPQLRSTFVGYLKFFIDHMQSAVCPLWH